MTGLTLPPYGFAGILPAAFGDLAQLQLEDTGLRVEIPRQLGQLANLIDLDLYDNQLTGCIAAALTKIMDSCNLLSLGLPDWE